MRDRIKAMRKQLVDEHPRARARRRLQLRPATARHVLLLRPDARTRCCRLREEYSIYAIDTGRICVAALNSKNVDYVADAIAKVIK